MDTDSQSASLGRLKGSAELRKSLDEGKQENYSNSSAGYKDLYAKICTVYYLPALAIANARSYVYFKKNPSRYFDPDGPASPSSGQFDSSSGGGVG
jgi:hypothetical protein